MWSIWTVFFILSILGIIWFWSSRMSTLPQLPESSTFSHLSFPEPTRERARTRIHNISSRIPQLPYSHKPDGIPVATSPPVKDRESVALCILGEARTMTKSAVWQSQLKHVLGPLRQEGFKVDVVAVLGSRDNSTQVINILTNEFRAARADFLDYPSQYDRFLRCLQLLPRSGYTWVIRIRPDLLFYAPLGPIRGLSQFYVYVRLRCERPLLQRSFTEDEISSEHVFLLRLACAKSPLKCDCLQRGCGKHELRIDDQAAIVPARYVDVFFKRHNCTAEACKCCCLTRNLVNGGVAFRTYAFTFTIARAQDKFGTNSIVPDGEGGRLRVDTPADKVTKHEQGQGTRYMCTEVKSDWKLVQCSPMQSGSTLIYNWLRILAPGVHLQKSDTCSFPSADARDEHVVTMRHPVDSIVSSIVEYKTGRFPGLQNISEISVPELIEHREKYMRDVGDRLLSCASCLDRKRSNLLLLRYEDYMQDPALVIASSVQRLGYVADQSLISRIVKETSASQKSNLSGFSQYDWKTQLHGTGEYYHYLSAAQANHLKTMNLCGLIRKYGYTFFPCEH
eukprot:TRINITY_DN93232_c0_g1_i1.p1 TRINITY_DN93232_c0_g1~~TRINITY_DN93232_c0_g1_i1.p1  ORF type:complete len:564 (+),score=26.64 TRINITY_DN93232_c0_g1_i1:104-1795(+)